MYLDEVYPAEVAYPSKSKTNWLPILLVVGIGGFAGLFFVGIAAAVAIPNLITESNKNSAGPTSEELQLWEQENQAPPLAYRNWYPEEIVVPSGVSLKRHITPLPRSPVGIPPSHHKFINHTYALLVQVTIERTKAYQDLQARSPSSQVLDEYIRATRELQHQLWQEKPPESLQSVQDDILAALDYQMDFFMKAFPERRAGTSFKDVHNIKESRDGSQLLMAAWFQLRERYPDADQETLGALRSHLCALDIH